MVAAARAVGVEVLALHAVLGRYRPAGVSALMEPAGRDVVGGDRVAELGQHAGTGDVRDRRRLAPPCPRSTGACARRSSSGPTRRCCRSGWAARASARRPRTRRRSREANISLSIEAVDDVARPRLGVGQMSRRKTGVAVLVVAQRVGREVEVHRAGEGVGDDQRRGRQVVHLDVGVDPALEVAVARQHRGTARSCVVDRGDDRLGQRAGVADAGGAAVADEVEAELLQVRGQAGLLVVVGDDLRARGQRWS